MLLFKKNYSQSNVIEITKKDKIYNSGYGVYFNTKIIIKNQ